MARKDAPMANSPKILTRLKIRRRTRSPKIILSPRCLSSLIYVFASLIVTFGGIQLWFSLNCKALLSPSQRKDSLKRTYHIKIFSGQKDVPPSFNQWQYLNATTHMSVDHVIADERSQFRYLQSHNCAGVVAVERFQQLVDAELQHLAHELWKYCALLHHGGLYLDAESPLVSTLDQLLSKPHKNIAVLNDPSFPRSIHGSLLLLREPGSKIAQGMVQVLMTTALDVLDTSPLLLPQTLYDLIASEASTGSLYPGVVGDEWFLLQHRCSVDSLRRSQVSAAIKSYGIDYYRARQVCPEPNSFCCSVSDTVNKAAMLVTEHIILPHRFIPHASQLPKPFNAQAGHYETDDLPYISTLREKINTRPEEPLLTPNTYDILLHHDCLPSDERCLKCLRTYRGANFKSCRKACPCYSANLCRIPLQKKFVSKEVTISPPIYARDPSRLVPRIVHQTWFEDVSKEKYPNLSRLMESFKQSGWQYKFYTDDEAGRFLSTHFPPEIREAYEKLIPGAFKADLFRYCVLLIHGGVYADVDILLESNLDFAVTPDIGFMVSMDTPGTPTNTRMCLWNGFIAAAPGHPFLAKVIQDIVNHVRNRFTVVDVVQKFCPTPELSIFHKFPTLFVAGPCALGSTINSVLGRSAQKAFKAGELKPWDSSSRKDFNKGVEFIHGVSGNRTSKIPGRTILLHQNKSDMGEQRFTHLERNLLIFGTDLPGSDDLANTNGRRPHYSESHNKSGVYGEQGLYMNNKTANEDILFYIDTH